MFDRCALNKECRGVVQETDSKNPRVALVKTWNDPKVGEMAPRGSSSYLRHHMEGSYGKDAAQKGMGLRLGDCMEGTFETNVFMPFAADWDFRVKTVADTSPGSYKSDYVDIYFRPDGGDKYALLSRHLNDRDTYSPIRISNSQRFALMFKWKSSSPSLSRHMRIERAPLAVSKVIGDEKLTYTLAPPSTNGCEPAGSTNAAHCPWALFRMDPHTGQLRLHTINVLDVAERETFVLTVYATDPQGLRASSTLTVTVLKSNDVPQMEDWVLHVDENMRSVQTIWDISPAMGAADQYSLADATRDNCGPGVGANNTWDECRFNAIETAKWTYEYEGEDVPGVLGYVGSPSDVAKGQFLRYAISAGNYKNSFSINPKTGVFSLTASASLDFEVASTLKLSVLATDNGIGPMKINGFVTVYVHDVNEVPWLPDTTRYVKENSARGVLVGAPIQGADHDAGDVLSYAFVNGPTELEIATKTGQMTTTDTTLDYESVSTY
jgi:hypothetical protein